MWPALIAALLVGSGSSTAASPPGRIVFASSRTTVAQLYSEEPSGRGLAQLTFGPGGWSAPLPSLDGRYVAAFRAGALWLMRGDGRDARLVAATTWTARSWSRDSRVLAFASAGGIWTIKAAGGPPRQVTHGYDDHSPSLSPDGRSISFLRWEGVNVTLVVRRHGWERIVLRRVSGVPSWSPDGRWIAVAAGADQDLELIRPSGRGRRVLVQACGYYCDPAWSPDGRRLAYADGKGLHVVERSGRGERLLATGEPQGFAWSPRGRAIAFATASAVEVVTLGGDVRTLLRFGPYEAQPGVGWTAAAPGLSYQTPEENPLLVRVSSRELEARVPIAQFSADGDRVAYWLCPHIFGVWRPGEEQPLSLGPATLVACRPQQNMPGNFVQDLALAGERLAYLTAVAANRVHRTLMLTTLERDDEGVEIAQGAYDYGDPPALDDVVGGGSALVYGTRESLVTAPPGPETIWRVDGDKPVQITFDPDDLQPLAVDQGRIVARRADGALELLDLDGGVLRTLDVSALGAALAGDDLVVHVRGELRDYSASTGDLRYVWPLPDVSSAKLDDAARGVAVYSLDGVVHLLRLRDGVDKTVPDALAAELTDAGLFYSFAGKEPWPGGISFVPFAELPLR